MAIHNNNRSSTHIQQRPPPQPAHKPPLFVRSIISQGAILHSISCSLLPPHAISRASVIPPRPSSRPSSTVTPTSTTSPTATTPSSSSTVSLPPSIKSCRQLVLCTLTSLQVFDIDDKTLSLYPLSEIMIFTSIYDIASISTPIPGRDALIVLSENGMINFLQFDEQINKLRCLGQRTLNPYLLNENTKVLLNAITSGGNINNVLNNSNNDDPYNININNTIENVNNTGNDNDNDNNSNNNTHNVNELNYQHSHHNHHNHNNHKKSMKNQPRLISVHSRRNIVAVASLKSQIVVFPLIFLPKNINSGKIANILVDGTILSIDFLVTDNDVNYDNNTCTNNNENETIILIVLIQKNKDQLITLYSININKDANHNNKNHGSLTVFPIGSMITCAIHPDDIAVAKATSKFTGKSISPVPPAIGVSKIHNCPYLFVVFIKGKIIIGDARSVILSSTLGEDISSSVGGAHGQFDDQNSHFLPPLASAMSSSSSSSHRQADSNTAQILPSSPEVSISNNEDNLPVTPNQNIQLSASPTLNGSQSGGGTPTGARITTPADGFVTPVQQPVRREPPNAPLQTRRSVRAVLRNDMPIPPSLVRRAAAGLVSVGSISAFQLSGIASGGNLNASNSQYRSSNSNNNSNNNSNHHQTVAFDDYAYLYVPAYVSRDIDESNGIATSWVSSDNHFNSTQGIYFVMESGALYVLRWNHDQDDDKDNMKGSITFKIPQKHDKHFNNSNIESADMKATLALSKSKLLQQPKFSIEYVGDVGPAVTIAALDRRLLYIANDGCDGSLRRIILPGNDKLDRKTMKDGTHSIGLNRRISGRTDNKRYGLEVRQEFLNMSPISDFIITSTTHNSNNKDRTNNDKQQSKSSSRPNQSTSSMDLTWDENINIDDVNYNYENQSALDHVLDGRYDEPELIVCSGIGKYGNLKFIRPGAPVSVFASSSRTFPPCNNMWSLKFSSQSIYDRAIVMTYVQATRLLLSSPEAQDVGGENDADDEGPTKSGSLIDGTDAIEIVKDKRTICMGLLEDGILAQIHEEGIRLIYLKKAIGEQNMNHFVINEVLQTSICEKTMDWVPPSGCFISIGTIGCGFIMISVIQKQISQCVLYLLKCYPNDPSLGLVVISSTEINYELSCIEIPSWTNVYKETDFSSPLLPPMAVLGTYNPSIEIRLLGPTMEKIVERNASPWCIDPSRRNLYSKKSSSSPSTFRNTSSVGNESNNDNRYTDFSQDIGLTLDIMTAVPESICSIERNGKRLIFTGLRDGSVMVLTLSEEHERDIDNARLSSTTNVNTSPASSSSPLQNNTALRIKAHRKLGDRPVTVKSLVCAIGNVIIAQTERPWMGTFVGNSSKVSWTPLAFKETRALCSFSVPKADNCFAVAAEDDAFYICGIRRREKLSVRSVLIGSTPRRVLSPEYPKNSVVVATSGSNISSPSPSESIDSIAPNDVMNNRTGGNSNSGRLGRSLSSHSNYNSGSSHPSHNSNSRGLDIDYRIQEYYTKESMDNPNLSKRSELLLFNRKNRQKTATIPLMEYELVHVLLNWMDFIIVGTSFGSRSYYDSGNHKLGKRGRLLLMMICDTEEESSNERYKFEICSEMILPGSVICGAVSENEDFLAISCNKEVLVFTLISSRNVMIQVARTSARTLVIGLSIKDDIVSIIDKKDSIGFFQLKTKYLKLVRDRNDHTRRIISDGLLIDRTLSIAVDRFGGLFSVGYQNGDHPPKINKNHLKSTAMKSPLLRSSLLNKNHEQSNPMLHYHPNLAASSFIQNNMNLIDLIHGEHDQVHDSPPPGMADNPDNDAMALMVGAAQSNENNETQGPSDHGANEDENVGPAHEGIVPNLGDHLDPDDDDDDDDDNDDDDEIHGLEQDEEDAGVIENEEIVIDEWGNPTGMLPAEDDDMADEHVVMGEGMVVDNDDDNILPVGIGEHDPRLEESDEEEDSRLTHSGIPRNLVSHHSFNMRDPALRIRLGTFTRAENLTGREHEKEDLFKSKHMAVFCGTLGGAIVSAVGMSSESFALLSQVELEMGSHPEIAEPALDSSHRKVRSAYGPRAVGAIDGDLLSMFETLSDASKLDIVHRVGLEDEEGILLIEGVIQHLCDRVV